MLAEDERLGRKVAVKRLHAESPEDAGHRFEREAKLGASLNHPNIVAVYDIDTDDEGVLIVMEYVEGETLRDAMDAGPMPPGARDRGALRHRRRARPRARAGRRAPRREAGQRADRDADGMVKLADLGIATAADGRSITQSGDGPRYRRVHGARAARGRAAGAGADIYSLAVVAFETLTGPARP